MTNKQALIEGVIHRVKNDDGALIAGSTVCGKLFVLKYHQLFKTAKILAVQTDIDCMACIAAATS